VRSSPQFGRTARGAERQRTRVPDLARLLAPGILTAMTASPAVAAESASSIRRPCTVASDNAASRGAAHEPSPITDACPLGLLHEATPALAEWAYWVNSGASLQGERWTVTAGVGSEVTAGLVKYSGFPAGALYAGRWQQAEIRGGVWGAFALRPDGGLLEGGLKLHWGAVYHASFGTWELRAGAGYGAFVNAQASHLSFTFAYGVRSALDRYAQRSMCSPLAVPRVVGMVSVARLFVTYRRGAVDASLSEMVIGLELSPTFLLPPFSWMRLGGGPSR
jgi:hypothetical protein